MENTDSKKQAAVVPKTSTFCHKIKVIILSKLKGAFETMYLETPDESFQTAIEILEVKDNVIGFSIVSRLAQQTSYAEKPFLMTSTVPACVSQTFYLPLGCILTIEEAEVLLGKLHRDLTDMGNYRDDVVYFPALKRLLPFDGSEELLHSIPVSKLKEFLDENKVESYKGAEAGVE